MCFRCDDAMVSVGVWVTVFMCSFSLLGRKHTVENHDLSLSKTCTRSECLNFERDNKITVTIRNHQKYYRPKKLQRLTCLKNQDSSVSFVTESCPCVDDNGYCVRNWTKVECACALGYSGSACDQGEIIYVSRLSLLRGRDVLGRHYVATTFFFCKQHYERIFYGYQNFSSRRRVVLSYHLFLNTAEVRGL